MDYYDKMAKSHDQMAVASETQMKNETNVSTSRSLNTNDNDSATQRNQEPRFGFTNVGSTGSVCSKFLAIIQMINYFYNENINFFRAMQCLHMVQQK